MDERPGGIFAKIPSKGIGKGNAGDAETWVSRCKCKVELRKCANGVLVLRTETAKNEHHLWKEMVSSSKLRTTFIIRRPLDRLCIFRVFMLFRPMKVHPIHQLYGGYLIQLKIGGRFNNIVLILTPSLKEAKLSLRRRFCFGASSETEVSVWVTLLCLVRHSLLGLHLSCWALPLQVSCRLVAFRCKHFHILQVC